MRQFILLLLLFSAPFVSSQTDNELQNQINQELWKPFKTAFETLDASALNTLYAEEVLRVTPNGIDTKNIFKKANIDRFETYRKAETKVLLDFWFDSRHTNNSHSYEVGFYRMQLLGKRDKQVIYGQFHIVLKRKDGHWRITQDWDTATINDRSITVEDFNKKEFIRF